MTLGEAK